MFDAKRFGLAPGEEDLPAHAYFDRFAWERRVLDADALSASQFLEIVFSEEDLEAAVSRGDQPSGPTKA